MHARYHNNYSALCHYVRMVFVRDGGSCTGGGRIRVAGKQFTSRGRNRDMKSLNAIVRRRRYRYKMWTQHIFTSFTFFQRRVTFCFRVVLIDEVGCKMKIAFYTSGAQSNYIQFYKLEIIL
jgi:hypothetical protein